MVKDSANSELGQKKGVTTFFRQKVVATWLSCGYGAVMEREIPSLMEQFLATKKAGHFK